MSSILITGASKGIGRATAAELARRGHRVVATARDPRTLDGLDVDQRLRLDVTDQAGVETAIGQAGDIDVLISNAGVIFSAAVEASPIPEIERLFALNTFGAIRVTQAVLPRMRNRGKGRLLFVSSTSGRTVLPGSSAYSASKWALEAFAETLAIELAGFGIDVTLAEPGPVSSGALDDVLYIQPARRSLSIAAHPRSHPRRHDDQPRASRRGSRRPRGTALRSAPGACRTGGRTDPRGPRRRPLRPALRPRQDTTDSRVTPWWPGGWGAGRITWPCGGLRSRSRRLPGRPE